MLALDKTGYFITGSDTDVGKTYIACQIVRQIRELGYAVETRKPAESGCGLSDAGELVAQDALALQQANAACESIERIAPFRLRAALAPHRAARFEGRHLLLEELVDACQARQQDSRLIVEGAGGFYSPLAEDGLNADLASALQLPLIIVVDDRVGAVNQALMTIQAVQSRQLAVAAVVLNQVQASVQSGMDNAGDLQSFSDCALYRCAHNQSLARIFEEPHA